MSGIASRQLRLNISATSAKQDKSLLTPPLVSNGSLSPNLQPPTPPILSPNQKPCVSLPSTFGDKYIMIEQIETSNLFRCVDKETMREFCCKIVPTRNYHQFLSGHLRMDGHSGINTVEEVLVGNTQTLILFSPSYGDLHSYVRNKKRLREGEAMHLFRQIAEIVANCHNNGIILRDLKLRKFMFSDKERTQLKLETLEDAVVLEESDDDWLSDKHGCPAYVSPEILSTAKGGYSAKGADCWSLGVILYTMLVGRYPFHDTNPSMLFCKIRKGTFVIPDTLSSHAKCLIRSLMRREPSERLSAEDILSHRWFKHYTPNLSGNYSFLNTGLMASPTQSLTNAPFSNSYAIGDQTVPDLIDIVDTSHLSITRD